jgi:hypothetical protein
MQFCGVNDVYVIGNLEVETAVRTSPGPYSRFGIVKKVMYCAAFAPVCGAVTPETEAANVVDDGNQ